MGRRACWSSLGGAAGAYSRSRQEKGTLVTAETVQQRDLEAIVSASGKIEPKRSVNISAQSMGRVTRLGVNEGDRVKRRPVPAADRSGRRRSAGAPRRSRGGRRAHRRSSSRACRLQSARGQPRRRAAGAEAPAGAVGGGPDHARIARARARPTSRCARAISTRASRRSRPARAGQSAGGRPGSSRYNLTQVRFESPFDGIVTRRNIEEGENVVVGTMNNAGTVLLTVADMSVIEAEVEVDETDIPFVQLGQTAKSPSTRSPARRSPATSPRSATARFRPPAPARHAHRDELQGDGHARRADPRRAPGFTCTAEITTATQEAGVVAVPIQALTVRELLYDAQGNVVHEQRPPPRRASSFGRRSRPPAPRRRPSCKPGQKREEVEGVFVMQRRQGRVRRSSRPASPASATSKC